VIRRQAPALRTVSPLQLLMNSVSPRSTQAAFRPFPLYCLPTFPGDRRNSLGSVFMEIIRFCPLPPPTLIFAKLFPPLRRPPLFSSPSRTEHPLGHDRPLRQRFPVNVSGLKHSQSRRNAPLCHASRSQLQPRLSRKIPYPPPLLNPIWCPPNLDKISPPPPPAFILPLEKFLPRSPPGRKTLPTG